MGKVFCERITCHLGDFEANLGEGASTVYTRG